MPVQGVLSFLFQSPVGIAVHAVFSLGFGAALGTHATVVFSTFETEYGPIHTCVIMRACLRANSHAWCTVFDPHLVAQALLVKPVC